MAAPPAQAAGACDREGGDDDDPIINQDGCGRFYGLLEECMGEHNRDWRKCQAQLRAASAARMLTGLMGCYYFKKYHAVPYTLRGDQGQGEAGIF